jgi:type IV secretory pathway VirB10-like protein
MNQATTSPANDLNGEAGNGAPVSIQGQRPGVTRISRRAVMIAAIFAASLGLVVLMTGFGGQRAPTARNGPEENAIRPTGPVESVRDLPADYGFDVRNAARGIGYGPLTASTGSATQPAVGSPQEQAIVEQLRQIADVQRKLLEEQRKEQDQALDSPLVFSGAKPVLVTSGNPSTSATTRPPMFGGPGDLLGLANALGAAAGGNGAGNGGINGAGGVLANHQNEKEAFLSQSAAIEPYLGKPLLKPISKYELKAGSIISGALVTAINTDLPGEIIGQVTENVYDSASGNYLLVPQGSKLLGKYQSLVSNGQNRALLVWQRLIYPNGNSIILDGMAGTDQIGQSGLADQVNYHLDKLVEATVLSTAIAYAGNLARNPNSRNGNSNGDVIGDTVAQQADRVGAKFIDRELDVQPTITIRSGWPLRVLVNKDMILEPYQPAVN